MKGFPNQIAELPKLANGMGCLARLVDEGANAKDDGVFGQALVRGGIVGTGHTPRPVEVYITEQLTKKRGNQSFRTAARGLRELYRRMGFIDDSGLALEITGLGRQAAMFAGSPMDAVQVNFWRRVVRNITHADDHGTSHPYQVLLRLVARKPGITRAICALALVADDDSPDELDRIVALADLPQNAIIARIGVKKSNWDNAKKVLPRFAEQLKDVIRYGNSYVLADSPGRADGGTAAAGAAPTGAGTRHPTGARAPRSSREVTPETIGLAGIADRPEEIEIPPELDPAAMAAAIKLRADRLRRHNLLVRMLATRLVAAGARIFEHAFDILALIPPDGILVEVKTLDGTIEDERDRVRDALSQLLYYESFVTEPVAGAVPIRKIACFERSITDPHRAWLNKQGIATAWVNNGAFVGDALASDFLGHHLEEFRRSSRET